MYLERTFYRNAWLPLGNHICHNSWLYLLYLGSALPYRNQPLSFFFLSHNLKNSQALHTNTEWPMPSNKWKIKLNICTLPVVCWHDAREFTNSWWCQTVVSKELIRPLEAPSHRWHRFFIKSVFWGRTFNLYYVSDYIYSKIKLQAM